MKLRLYGCGKAFNIIRRKWFFDNALMPLLRVNCLNESRFYADLTLADGACMATVP